MAIRHPTGPNLPGHRNCGPGKIFDHKAGRCIGLAEYRKKYGSVPKTRKA
ncbi:MAG TPA: hypothetical protein VM537_15315 [Anaerolineae bacterium]|nr:hypothetical protein [Anaerolineae bacterium]